MGQQRLTGPVQNENGMALLVVLFVFTIIAILGISALSLTASNTKMSAGERDAQSVYYIAESGATYMENEIRQLTLAAYPQAFDANDFFSRITAALPLQTTYEKFESAFGQKPHAEITVDCAGEVVNDTKSCRILSKGLIGERSRTVTQTVHIRWAGKQQFQLPGEMAVYVDHGTMTISNGTVNGNIGTTSSAANTINISGGAKIQGNIYVGQGGETHAINAPDWKDHPDPIPIPDQPALQLPPFPDFPSGETPENEKICNDNGKKENCYNVIQDGNLYIDDWRTDGYTLTLDRDLSFKRINLNANNTLNINVGNSDRSLIVNDLEVTNGHILIKGTGKLTIYIKGHLTMGSGSTINDKGSTSKLNVYLKGTGKTLTLDGAQQIFGSLFAEDANITMTGGSRFRGVIVTGGKTLTISGGHSTDVQILYAPNADVNIGGGGNVKGAIYAKNFNMSGGGTVTFQDFNGDLPFFPGGSIGSGSGDPGGSDGSEVTPDELVTSGPIREK